MLRDPFGRVNDDFGPPILLQLDSEFAFGNWQ